MSARDHTSIPCCVVVEAKRHRWGRTAPRSLPGTIVDVSATGAGIDVTTTGLADEALAVGNRLTLRLDGLAAEAIVRHQHSESGGLHIGIEFDGISHDFQVKLHDAAHDNRGMDTDQAEELWNHAH